MARVLLNSRSLKNIACHRSVRKSTTMESLQTRIALRRARRILLDERVTTSDLGTFSAQRMNDDLLEHYVSGSASSGISITGSPIPGIAAAGNDEAVTLEVARLVCAFLLVLTNTVERITTLDLRRTSGGISVDFVGIRARQYSNVDPRTLRVSGICPLT
jgi:hypothetical protein